MKSISILIPTYKCLENIRAQYADAGSTDSTLEIAKQYKVDKILSNPLKTGEAGKAVGVRANKTRLLH